MDLGGWLTRSVFDRYRIVSDSDMREALRKASQAVKPTRLRRTPDSPARAIGGERR